MNTKTVAIRSGWWSVLCMLSVAVCGCAIPIVLRTQEIPFELTGTVLDKDSRSPIEGAYVVASYREKIVGPATLTSWCIKTRGMYTGPDGRFHFPVEKLDGHSPLLISAIKADYVRGEQEFPEPSVWKKQGIEAYSNRILTLATQSPAQPSFDFGYGDEFCHHAPTAKAAEAGAQFLKIQVDEMLKYNAAYQSVDAVKGMIYHLESNLGPKPAR